jgi:hypothetical protein
MPEKSAAISGPMNSRTLPDSRIAKARVSPRWSTNLEISMQLHRRWVFRAWPRCRIVFSYPVEDSSKLLGATSSTKKDSLLVWGPVNPACCIERTYATPAQAIVRRAGPRRLRLPRGARNLVERKKLPCKDVKRANAESLPTNRPHRMARTPAYRTVPHLGGTV